MITIEFNLDSVTEAIQAAFRRSGMTQKQLSQISGVPESTIQKFFSGDIKEPRFENVVRLIKALRLSCDDLIGIDANMAAASALAEVERLQREIEILQARTETAEANARAEQAEAHAERERLSALKEAHSIILAEKEKTNTRLYKCIITVGTMFAVLVAALVGVLIYDLINLDRGWFQAAAAYFKTGIQHIIDIL